MANPTVPVAHECVEYDTVKGIEARIKGAESAAREAQAPADLDHVHWFSISNSSLLLLLLLLLLPRNAMI